MREKGLLRSGRARRGIYLLPNLFTTASLFCGFYAAVAAMKGLFDIAAVNILISAVLDTLDGRIARMTNTTSKFGSEYDSLVDLVAFGVAPALLVYAWALGSFGKWGWIIAFLFVACGALRLARFNVQIGTIDNRVFNGLPIPAAACMVATGVLLYFHCGGDGVFPHPSILVGVFLLSLLMVSNVKFYSFKDLNFFARKPFMTFVLIVLILVIIVAEPQIMIFTFFAGYVISGPVWSVCKIAKKAAAKIRERKDRSPKLILF